MRWILMLCALLLGGTVSAQNNPPMVTVKMDGAHVPNSGSIVVEPDSAFNDAMLTYEVDDPEGDNVECTAVVSNEGAAVGWSAADFEVAAQATPYTENITAAGAEFGPEGTVHVVTLTFDDGADDVIFSFTINVTSSDPGNSTPGGSDGACTVGAPVTPWGLVALAGALLYRQRRRRAA